MLNKSALLFLLLFATNPIFAQFTDVINSNRPGQSMSAFSVGLTVIQAELGGYGIRQEHEYRDWESAGFGADFSLRYGAFFEQLEFVLDLQYQNDKVELPFSSYRRSALKTSTIGAKYLVFDPNKNYEKKPDLRSWKNNHKFSFRNFIPAVAVYAGANVNLSDNEFSFPDDRQLTPKFMVMTQNQFGRYVLVLNFIADKYLTNHPTNAYIITLTRGFHERLSAFVENQGIQSDYYADAIVRGGAAWLVYENIQLDASIGTSLKTTPSMLQAGIGISWRFDDNYEDVLLSVPTEDKKGKKDKKAKKEKKRKDEVETEMTP
ncbi:MAG TPA: transporter [Flavobacterium sp.]|jgi:hypothetical protein